MAEKWISNDLRSKDQFKTEVVKWAEKITVNPGQIRIQKMKKKWASCSTNGWVCFSADLLKEPRAYQDYVIVHELLHLQVPNHGKLFKRVRKKLPAKIIIAAGMMSQDNRYCSWV